MEKEKSEEFKISTKAIKDVKNFFMNKKIQNIILIVLLLGVIFLGSYIRLQPVLNGNLIDSTTGDHIPLALDPFYFIRVAETIVENGGNLPKYDNFRYPTEPTSFTHSTLPKSIAFFYNISDIFSDTSVNFVGIIIPVIFYILGLIVFFFLSYRLTRSKLSSLIGSVFLAFIPSYLYRTLAGFADHEASGMFALFLTLLGFTISVQKLDKNKIKKYLPIILGSIVGLFTAFTVASWGGISNFAFMILPLSILIIWLVKIENNRNNWKRYLLFYSSWIFSSLIFGPVMGMEFGSVLSRLFNPTGLISIFTLAFIGIDSLLLNINFEKRFNKKKNFNRILYSLFITLIIGIIFLIIRGDFFFVVSDLFTKILNPFSSAGDGRLGATVAENASPYISDWKSQTGRIFFWISMSGLALFGFKFFEKIKGKKNKSLALFSWFFLIAGIFFSRYSSNSLFNGDNFISQLFFFGSIIWFVWTFGKLYYKNKLELNSSDIIIFSWMLLMLIGARGAMRLLFVISPFFCFISGWNFGYLIERLGAKEDLNKMFVVLAFIILIIASFVSLSSFVNNSNIQAENITPSASWQWQNAMSWVRENTSPRDVFVHWWDYGYWVQGLGKRPTVTDGGHAAGDLGDHYIGRYILTTDNPETAYSFMKTHNVSYLLIDPTELGKYGAYSKIGSDENFDRFSYLPIGRKDLGQTQEFNNRTVDFYPINSPVDEDIIYEKDSGEKVFIPGPTYDESGNPSYKAIMGGVMIEKFSGEGISVFAQPQAVFIYNGDQVRIPLRYLYIQDELKDFEGGLNSTLMIIPSITNSNRGISIDSTGAGIYLSEKVSRGLFAKVYLMGDPLEEYSGLKISHFQSDVVINSLRSQGTEIGEFVFFQGFRGPIKIWEVDYPQKTPVHEEFTSRELFNEKKFGGLDYLFE